LQADPCYLFCSLQEFHPGFFPGTGHYSEVGIGDARGQTVNVPLPPDSGDAVYGECFDEIVGPVLKRFKPELILVSAGFDAHWTDPLGMMAVSTTGFVEMVRKLAGWADEICAGKLALVLEGGYNLEALAANVLAVVQTLGGDVPVDQHGPPQGEALPPLTQLVEQIKRVHDL